MNPQHNTLVQNMEIVLSLFKQGWTPPALNAAWAAGVLQEAIDKLKEAEGVTFSAARCPRCGSAQIVIEKHRDRFDERHWYFPRCQKCNCAGCYNATEERAAQLWAPRFHQSAITYGEPKA